MPRSRKINQDKVQASLDTPCPKCGFSITPAQIRRVDFERVECPKCGEKFQPNLDLPLSEFLQGPIGAFVGTTGTGTKFEDVPLVENLGFGTGCVLISPGIRCQTSDCPRNLAGGFSNQHRKPDFRGSVKPSAASKSRSLCEFVRGIPVLSSQRSPRLAPQVGQENASTCLGVRSLDFIPT
jgi:predicted RNA-binding Zn-ribbon protein involved in translation (DUF1610 family)